MLSTNKFLTVFLLVAAVFSTSGAMAACTTDGNGAVTIDSTDPGDSCNGLTPDGYQVKFYYLGLCPSMATMPSSDGNTAADYSACTTIFESANGQTLNLSVGDSVDLTGAEKPQNGTYGYAVAILANTFGITHTETFSSTDSGSNSATVLGETASGSICWSNGGTYYNSAVDTSSNWNTRSNYHVECGSAAGTASMTTEILDTFGRNNANTAYLFVFPESGYGNAGAGETVTGGKMQAAITNSNLYTATSAGSAGGSTRIFAQIAFTTPVTISDATINADVKFNVSQGSNLLMAPSGTTGQYLLWSYGSGPFSVLINTTDQ